MWPKNKQQEDFIKISKEISNQISSTAAKHDRDGTFPHNHFSLMKSLGYIKASVPEQFGGNGHGLTDLALAQFEIGKGNGATAISVGMHHMVVGTEVESEKWPTRLRRRIFEKIAEEDILINNIASEPELGSPRGGGRPSTTLEQYKKNTWILNGRKTWSTLAPELGHAIVYAAVEDGTNDTARVSVDMSGKGITIEETWDSMSMRSSGSHDIVFENVFISGDQFISRSNTNKPIADGPNGAAWFPVLVSAANLGIAYAARSYAIEFAKTRRPGGSANTISEIPHIREQIAKMESMILVAKRSLFSCSEDWEHYVDQRKDLLPEVLITKVNCVESAISVTDIAMRIVGAVGLEKNRPLERFFRDVRSGISNPPIEARALEALSKSILD